MPTYDITVEADVKIKVTDEGEQGMRRFVGLSEEAAREIGVKPGLTFDQILLWLATNSICYGRHNANQDGFADLDPDSILVDVTDVREY